MTGVEVPALRLERFPAKTTSDAVAVHPFPGSPPVKTAVVAAVAAPQPEAFVATGLEQVPLVTLQVPATWQRSLAAQTTGPVFEHVPPRHAPTVQAWPSLQLVPSGMDALGHAGDPTNADV